MGMIITPGGPEDHSSFCSELAGIYGVLLTLEALAIPPNMACLVDQHAMENMSWIGSSSTTIRTTHGSATGCQNNNAQNWVLY